MTSAPSCPLCGNATQAAFTVTDRNRAITGERFHYRRCGSCETVFLSNVPDDLGRYYPADYYELPAIEALDRAADGEAPRLELLCAHAPGGRLVEIGAGLGVFSRAAERSGYDVTAIEMDARCCEYLERVVGARAICSASPEQAIAELPASRAIVMWHVLEHLPRPWAVLEQAAANLEQGGVLALAVPNPDAIQFRLLGGRWAHVDAPRHLFLIPFETLRLKMTELGLELDSVTTTDPAGIHWNAFGWEYALRRRPASRPSTPATHWGARLLALGVSPLERHGMRGTAYTAAFVKR